MCGRYTLIASPDELALAFELAEPPELTPRYNIAPTQGVFAVLAEPETGVRKHRMLHWGLIPGWAKDPGIGSRMINARAETLDRKPSFRTAFRKRRCLIAANGFFEWQKLERRKQPHFIRLVPDGPFAFAGLWEHWEGADGASIDSCTIVTTEPNELMAPIHNRMPVILRDTDYSSWLDPGRTDPSALKPLLQPLPASNMRAYAVDTYVNSPSHDGPRCIEPVC